MSFHRSDHFIGEPGKALLLAKEARRAVGMKEWTRNVLMKDATGDTISVTFMIGELKLVRLSGVVRTDNNATDCDDVQACCAAGYVTFAQICLAPVATYTELSNANQDVIRLMSHKLWGRADVRAAVKLALEENGRDVDALADWSFSVADEELGAISNGEGLVPWWNDNLAQSRDDIERLFDECVADLETEGGDAGA